MIDWMNIDDLFCEEHKSINLLEYSREISLLKDLISLANEYISEYECENVFTFEGVCSLFVRSVIQYAKSAYDNFLIGHFDVAYMLCRNMVENNVCLEVLTEFESEELWKYYLAYSFRHTWRLNPNSEYSKCLERQFEEICNSLSIEKQFFTDRNDDGRFLKPFIDENYGWTYKVNKKFSFSGLCQLLKTRRYKDFKFMSEFSHGTSLIQKMDDGNYVERVVGIMTSIYMELRIALIEYCPWELPDDFYDLEQEMGGLLIKIIEDFEGS